MGQGHRSRRGKVRLVLAGATVAAGLAGAAALAQEGEEGGLTLTFGLNSELRYDDNPDLRPVPRDAGILLDTRLSFGLSSITRTQKLSLSGAGTLRLAEGGGAARESGLERPELRFGYERAGTASRLALTARYGETDQTLFDSFFDLDPVTGLPVVTVVGVQATRIDRDVGLVLQTGIDRPLGFTLEARHAERDFRDTTNPELFPSQTDRLALTTSLQLSPVLQGGLSLSGERYEADDLDQTRRRTDRAGISLTYQIDSRTRFETSLGWSRVVTERALAADSRQEGGEAALALFRDLPLGSVGLSYSHSVTASGGRDTVSLSRQLELPASTIDVTLGASRGAADETSLTGRIAYDHEFKRGQLGLQLSRDVLSDNDGNDVLSTRLALTALRELGPRASLSLDLGLAAVEDGGAGAVDAARQANATLALQRQLTEDWSVSAGYRYRLTHQDDGTDATSNSVFLSVGRGFALRY